MTRLGAMTGVVRQLTATVVLRRMPSRVAFLAVVSFFLTISLLYRHETSEKNEHKHSSLHKNISEVIRDRETSSGAQSSLDFPRDAMNVLIVSSGPRSGSSFLGELLYSAPSTFYFFEPRHLTSKELNEHNFRKMLSNLMNCNFSGLNFTAPKNLFSILRHSSLEKCHRDLTSCRAPSLSALQEVCLLSSMRVMKTVLIPLAWLQDVLQDSANTLKIIHLYRDPRGSLLSSDTVNFPVNKTRHCQQLEEDINYSRRFEVLHPDNFFTISYEHLCQEASSVARELYHFITIGINEVCHRSAQQHRRPSFGQGYHDFMSFLFTNVKETRSQMNNRVKLPETMEIFLSTHTRPNFFTYSEDPYSTVRHTRHAYRNWRRIISRQDIDSIQSSCRAAILKLNHTLFSSLADVRNMSIEYVQGTWRPRKLRELPCEGR